MKSLLCFIVLLVTAGTAAVAAERFKPFTLELARGWSTEAVLKKYGAPSAILGKESWVYFNFEQSNPNARNPAFDTLVIFFTDGRASGMKITDGRVVRQLLALQAAQAARNAPNSGDAKNVAASALK